MAVFFVWIFGNPYGLVIALSGKNSLRYIASLKWLPFLRRCSISGSSRSDFGLRLHVNFIKSEGSDNNFFILSTYLILVRPTVGFPLSAFKTIIDWLDLKSCNAAHSA